MVLYMHSILHFPECNNAFICMCSNRYLFAGSRVGVKYNWSSTQVLQVLVIKYKYKYKYFEFSPIKYSSTSSTDTPSTSTSTKYKYECEHWLVYMYGEYQGGISRELPPCPMITPV